MPIYEFKCNKCEAVTEEAFDFHTEHKVICKKCEQPMNKLYQATPAIFRGGGWGGQK